MHHLQDRSASAHCPLLAGHRPTDVAYALSYQPPPTRTASGQAQVCRIVRDAAGAGCGRRRRPKKLAWPLRKDDTHKSRMVTSFFLLLESLMQCEQRPAWRQHLHWALACQPRRHAACRPRGRRATARGGAAAWHNPACASSRAGAPTHAPGSATPSQTQPRGCSQAAGHSEQWLSISCFSSAFGSQNRTRRPLQAVRRQSSMMMCGTTGREEVRVRA